MNKLEVTKELQVNLRTWNEPVNTKQQILHSYQDHFKTKTKTKSIKTKPRLEY